LDLFGQKLRTIVGTNSLKLGKKDAPIAGINFINFSVELAIDLIKKMN
jgi:hypothetical protein